jgi:benzylsuccinate CoA-transferase BbsF subunit
MVELGGFAAGPAVGKHLGDHGAEVVRIESTVAMDGFRGNYPPYKDNVRGTETAGMFAFTNNDKLSITLNLKNPDGLEVARQLLDRADVVVENFTPGTVDRLGLSYAELAARNPGLIMLSTCNQGQTGPHARHAGFGTHLTSLAGFTHLTGWADRTPALLFGPYIDYIAVGFGAIAVLAALDGRRRTGRGCHVDLSQYETGLQFMAPPLLEYFATGSIAGREGNRDVAAAPHGVYPCLGRDRWCAISVHDDGEWHRLRSAVGDPEWARMPALESGEGRRAGAAALDGGLAAWTSRLERDEVIARLTAAGVHVAPVEDMADLHTDPQLAARGFWQPVNHAVIGTYMAEGPAFRLSATPAQIASPAPLLGEHTEYVVTKLLGLSREEFERRQAVGAFE